MRYVDGMRLRGLLTSVFCVGATAAGAHPHIFVDAGLQLHFDDQDRLAAVRVVWVYDEFYSMLLVDDLGLDQDYTGNISAQEREDLSGFDMNWVEGYEGDLKLRAGAEPLDLTGPLEWTADYRDGRIITTHLRAVQDPPEPEAGPLVFEVYDPTYYTSYTIALDAMIEGRDDCRSRVVEPDWEAAEDRLQGALDELTAEGAGAQEIEADFPAVGAAFAHELWVQCAE